MCSGVLVESWRNIQTGLDLFLIPAIDNIENGHKQQCQRAGVVCPLSALVHLNRTLKHLRPGPFGWCECSLELRWSPFQFSLDVNVIWPKPTKKLHCGLLESLLLPQTGNNKYVLSNRRGSRFTARILSATFGSPHKVNKVSTAPLNPIKSKNRQVWKRPERLLR